MRMNIKAAAAVAGEFVAVASDDTLDHDGEVIVPGAFNPLPRSVPVHANHVNDVTKLVARAVPYYQGNKLMLKGSFAQTALAQEVRQLVADGVLCDLSVVFAHAQKKWVKGVNTILKAELVAVDFVSIGSNRSARVLTSRSHDHLLKVMWEAIAEAKATLVLIDGHSTPADKQTVARAEHALHRAAQLQKKR
jgi:HK97 family phage prohead protease